MNNQNVKSVRIKVEEKTTTHIKHYIDPRKWAIGQINGNYTLAAVNPETMIAYNVDKSYGWTDDVLEGFVFERWARGMDL